MNRQSELLKNIDWLSIFLYTLLVFMGWLNIYAAVYDESHSNILDIDLKYGCGSGLPSYWVFLSYLPTVNFLPLFLL